MLITKKKWIGIALLLVLTVVLIGSNSTKTNAQATPSPTSGPWCPSGTQLTGWAWSSNIGWISFNSKDTGAGGGPYCVAIEASTNLVKGWAWSSNIGWIKFGGLSGFPTDNGASTYTDAQIVSGRLEGWARACAGTIKAGDQYLSQNDYPVHKPKLKGDCTTMTSRPDGWDGWIELSGTNHAITYVSNVFSGYAWGPDVPGWISFDARTNVTAEPPKAPVCQMSNAEAPQPGYWTVSWGPTTTSGRLVSCRPIANMPDGSVNSTSGSILVNPSATTVYTVACAGEVPPESQCSTTVTVGGGGPGTQPPVVVGERDPGPIQMWLDADTAETKASTRIKYGSPIKINWKPTTSDTYSGCLPTLAEGTTNITLSSFGDSPRPNGSEYVKNGVPVGTYRFTMTCNSVTSPGTVVVAKTKPPASNPNARALSYLEIKIINPSESEF